MSAEYASVAVGPRFKHQEVSRFFPSDLQGNLVLDVGGFHDNPYFQQVVPSNTTVYSLNLVHEPHGRIPDVYGNGQELPFANEAFKLVTAIDVLEHVPYPRRKRVVEEMLRVAEKKVVICVPVDSPRNVKYEYELIQRMEVRELEPKKSTLEHRLLGLPTLSDLVDIGRAMRTPFDLYPSAVASTLFQSMYDQVDVLAAYTEPSGQRIVSQLAENAEEILMKAPQPSWEEAYRAIMVLKKNQLGRLVSDDRALFLSRNEQMAYQAALRQAGWGYGQLYDRDTFQFYKENPLRGRNIVIEGPEGSGKTSVVREIVKRLQEWGYDIAVQTDHGLRQRIRDMEKKMHRVIYDPERAEFFAFAMLEAAVAGNAYSLLGPCNISINDRGIESVKMHHGLHCPDNVTIPHLLEESHTLSVPPDLTIVLWVPNEEYNFYLMQKDDDLVNRTKGPKALAFQRLFYRDLVSRGGSQFTGRVSWIVNPGVEGSFESVVQQVLEAIETYCKIPTTH